MPEPMTISRRAVLGAGLAAALPAWAANKIDRSRVSVITDEAARSQPDSVKFAQQYGLKWIELRSVPGARKEYFQLPVADLKQAAKEFSDGGVRVSFLNTSMLKYFLPGAKPLSPRVKDTGRYDRRADELKQAIEAAHILGTNKVRIFTFMKVEDKEKQFPRIAEVINELAAVAAKEKIQLLVENEVACNVGTNAELVALLKHVPSKSVGINWDPFNAANSNEVAFPDGYKLLPAKRVGNVQIKGKSLLAGPGQMDWGAIFAQLAKDGYRGQVGLETHIFGEIQIQKSHECIKEILRLVES